MKRRTPKPAALAETHDFQAPKSPRQWAAEIAELPTRGARRAALEKVPIEWRSIVRVHVENTFAWKARR